MPFVQQIQSALPPQSLELLLLVSGWLVTFLLGRELGRGYKQWLARDERGGPRRPPPRP